jgi:hypothetical protein
VKRKAKPLDKPAAQLDGALALCGANNNIAGYDNVATRLRAGEVIGRAAGNRKQAKPRKPIQKRSNRVSS